MGAAVIKMIMLDLFVTFLQLSLITSFHYKNHITVNIFQFCVFSVN